MFMYVYVTNGKVESMQQLEKCILVLILINFLALWTCCKILFLCLICSLVIVLLIKSVEMILQINVSCG